MPDDRTNAGPNGRSALASKLLKGIRGRPSPPALTRFAAMANAGAFA